MIHEIHMWKTHGTHFVFSFCITCLNFTCVMKKKKTHGSGCFVDVTLQWVWVTLYHISFLSDWGGFILSFFAPKFIHWAYIMFFTIPLCTVWIIEVNGFYQDGGLKLHSHIFSVRNYLVLQVQKSNLKKYLNSSEKKVQRKIKYCKIVIKSTFVSFLALNP